MPAGYRATHKPIPHGEIRNPGPAVTTAYIARDEVTCSCSFTKDC
jgi:hypothetical protein